MPHNGWRDEDDDAGTRGRKSVGERKADQETLGERTSPAGVRPLTFHAQRLSRTKKGGLSARPLVLGERRCGRELWTILLEGAQGPRSAPPELRSPVLVLRTLVLIGMRGSNLEARKKTLNGHHVKLTTGSTSGLEDE